MDKIKILFIIGSLKKSSSNRQLSEYAKDYIADRAEVEYLDYFDIPLINPDIEFPTPKEVARVREKIKECDGVWMFFPEYNHSYPAQLKNLLDWISRPVEKGAPRTTSISSDVCVTYSSVSGKGGAERAFVIMQELLDKIHMNAMQTSLTALSEPEMENGRLVLSKEASESLKLQADKFIEFVLKNK